ncbi:MAG: hypothetical protein QM723_14125 [Myxococcaceae bacterium]
MATAAELSQALRTIAPRPSQVLAWRFLGGHPAAESATRYGITVEAFDLLLLRSAAPLVARFGVDPKLPDDFAHEQAFATQLRQALEGGGTHPFAPVLQELAAHKDEVRALLDAAEAEWQRSPAAARETWLRRVAIVVVVVLSAYFYWREQEAKKPHLEDRQGNLQH